MVNANRHTIHKGHTAVEYLYSNTRLEPGSLSEAFRNFPLTPEGRSTMADFQYYTCAGDPDALCDRR
jgi:hypothetical protein